MKRRVLAVLSAALLLATNVAAQQPKPPAPKPSAAPSAVPTASPAPTASTAPSELPPGHPPAGEDLPAGHPQIDDGEDGAGEGRGVPQDGAGDDPSLPPGTLIVTIKDVDEKPVPGAPVVLGINHSTVAKGDSSDRVVREADAAGVVRFDGIAHGSGYSFKVTTTRGAATYVLPTFGLTERAGKRAVLHSYEATGTLDNAMMLVMGGIVAVSLREDAIQVEQLVTVMNFSKVAWLADMPIGLPEGFKAFNKQDSTDDGHVDEIAGSGAAIRGTFPPGQRDLQFRYQIPLGGDATQALQIRLPQRITQARVIAEASKSMGLEVRGFPPARRVTGRDGKRLLITDLAARSPGEASTLDISLTGLPTHGPGRWIAVALAIAAFAAGIAYLVQSAGGEVDEDARRDLGEAREALLGELVALERARKEGEIGPKTYDRVRASLLDALARIVGMIEGEKGGRPSAEIAGRKRQRLEEPT